MNVKIILLLIVIAVLVIPESDAWGRRRRRRRRRGWVRKVFKWVCKSVCKGKICKWVKQHAHWNYLCHKACHKVCHKVFGKKRDALEDVRMSAWKPSYALQDLSPYQQDTVEIVPHPNEMSVYDLDNDSRISRDEFIAFYPESDEQETNDVFESIDTNGDQFMDCDEFLNSKLEFTKKPQC